MPATECVLRRVEMANGPIWAQRPYRCAPQVPQRHPDVAFKIRVAGEVGVLVNDGYWFGEGGGFGEFQVAAQSELQCQI